MSVPFDDAGFLSDEYGSTPMRVDDPQTPPDAMPRQRMWDQGTTGPQTPRPQRPAASAFGPPQPGAVFGDAGSFTAGSGGWSYQKQADGSYLARKPDGKIILVPINRNPGSAWLAIETEMSALARIGVAPVVGGRGAAIGDMIRNLTATITAATQPSFTPSAASAPPVLPPSGQYLPAQASAAPPSVYGIPSWVWWVGGAVLLVGGGAAAYTYFRKSR